MADYAQPIVKREHLPIYMYTIKYSVNIVARIIMLMEANVGLSSKAYMTPSGCHCSVLFICDNFGVLVELNVWRE